jgi:hypothetical protein
MAMLAVSVAGCLAGSVAKANLAGCGGWRLRGAGGGHPYQPYRSW